MRPDMRRWIVIGLWWSLPTLAAEPASQVPPEFLTCYGIQRTGERLACYDRAVEYLKQSGDKLAAPSAEASFGLQGRTKETREKDSSADAEQTAVTARVSEVSASRDGMKTITLDNGQTWRQITGSNAVFVEAGDEVTVSRGALGSFLMRVPNGGPLRVRRLK
ncbi:MAG: hypothetical protein SXG53_08000 [Pseudomonadota bacterium]|nr:hypothetical protein [Pseudomonadota bacterium]